MLHFLSVKGTEAANKSPQRDEKKRYLEKEIRLIFLKALFEMQCNLQ